MQIDQRNRYIGQRWSRTWWFNRFGSNYSREGNNSDWQGEHPGTFAGVRTPAKPEPRTDGHSVEAIWRPIS